MQSINANSQGNLHGPAWHLQSEFPLPGNPGSEDPSTDLVLGSLMEAIQVLGIPSMILQNIKGSLVKAISNIKRHNDQAGLALPMVICIFTQPGQFSKSGWGYFLIERVANHPLAPNREPYHSIELFLYREGSSKND